MTSPKGTAAGCRKGCVYSGEIGGMPCCNYCFIADKLRPCPAGKDCTVYKRGKRLRTKREI